jgi:trans-aconitate methyltransferase
MRERRNVFGEVAELYDDVRPGYPDDLVTAVLAEAGGAMSAVEVGAGTGKGTAAFVRRGVAVRCVEADPQMAAVLRARFTGAPVSVEVSRFEDWRPPAGGVPLLFCAQAWHWMDEATRCRLAYEALAPGGVLAVFGHRYLFADPAMETAVTRAYATHAPQLVDPDLPGRPITAPAPWLMEDLAASGLFADVRARRFGRTVAFPTTRYLDLVRTFSPFRMVARDRHAVVLAALAQAIDALGGVVHVRLDTVLATGRRERVPAS